MNPAPTYQIRWRFPVSCPPPCLTNAISYSYTARFRLVDNVMCVRLSQSLIGGRTFCSLPTFRNTVVLSLPDCGGVLTAG
jgi:hypothetical protein